MKIDILSEDTSQSFDIEYETANSKGRATLEMKDGGWQLTPRVGAETIWIANKRIDFPEALKRAIISLSML
jgi:hypothetical protein